MGSDSGWIRQPQLHGRSSFFKERARNRAPEEAFTLTAALHIVIGDALVPDIDE
jgi:hypothetical protein